MSDDIRGNVYHLLDSTTINPSLAEVGERRENQNEFR
jgi:hypothetical protein